jgi:uncharacterized membrane protein YwzB
MCYIQSDISIQLRITQYWAMQLMRDNSFIKRDQNNNLV